MQGDTLIAASDGEVLMSHVCPNATDFPKIRDMAIYSPTGSVNVCGESVAYWQGLNPGLFTNVTVASYPATLTAEAILAMVQEKLQ
jgi:hypothetical protein